MKLVSGLGIVVYPNVTERLQMYFVNRVSKPLVLTRYSMLLLENANYLLPIFSQNIFDRKGECDIRVLSWPAEDEESAESPPHGPKSSIEKKIKFHTLGSPFDFLKNFMGTCHNL